MVNGESLASSEKKVPLELRPPGELFYADCSALVDASPTVAAVQAMLLVNEGRQIPEKVITALKEESMPSKSQLLAVLAVVEDWNEICELSFDESDFTVGSDKFRGNFTACYTHRSRSIDAITQKLSNYEQVARFATLRLALIDAGLEQIKTP